MRKLIAGSAMAAMIACSTIAQAAPAAPVAIEDVRAGSSFGDSESMYGNSALILGLVGVAVLALIIWQVTDGGNDDDLPVSV